jgi:small GTP-binding protein
MKKRTIGILAHVDAGKTTLGEAILYACGKLKKMGRVDRGDTALDTHDLERRRGITIFSSQAQFSHAGVDFTLLDTPGHVDFAAEMERTLHVLDCAVLVISGSDGVQAHPETLWRLLRRYGVPVFLFVTKMDMPGADRAALLAGLRGGLSERILDFTVRPADEELAMCSEALLERYLDRGGVTDADITELIAARELFPCFFGSGLREEGVTEFLDGLARWAPAEGYGEDFAARVFKITRGARDERLTHVKLTGGALSVRDAVR